MSTYRLLNKEEIMEQANKETVRGVTIISNYTEAVAKNNSNYYNGTLKAQGNVEFKVWSGSLYDKLEKKTIRVFLSILRRKSMSGMILSPLFLIR